MGQTFLMFSSCEGHVIKKFKCTEYAHARNDETGIMHCLLFRIRGQSHTSSILRLLVCVWSRILVKITLYIVLVSLDYSWLKADWWATGDPLQLFSHWRIVANSIWGRYGDHAHPGTGNRTFSHSTSYFAYLPGCYWKFCKGHGISLVTLVRYVYWCLSSVLW